MEAVFATVSLFAPLRPDEIGRLARRFERVVLHAGASRSFAATSDDARFVIVISGLVDAVVGDPSGELRTRMHPGDRCGETMLLSGNPQPVSLYARRDSEIALIDRAGLDTILADYPAVALPLAAELASKLRIRDDQVRQVLELQASGLGPAQVEMTLQQLSRTLALRSANVGHVSARGLFRRFVVDRGAEPPFWMLVGFLSSLAGARLVVYLILKYKLEKQLFALVASAGANPMHIHHFNYGLILAALSGLAVLFPWGRRVLRTLSFVFGLGCGLVFDEFALFWNLNPDYSQGLSLISAAIAGIALVQLTYFRRFWRAMAARAGQRIRGE